MELAALSFVERKKGFIVAGSSGTGKAISPRPCSLWDATNSNDVDMPSQLTWIEQYDLPDLSRIHSAF
jgi:hypothetical protein